QDVDGTEKIWLAAGQATDIVWIDSTVFPDPSQYSKWLLPLDDMGYDSSTIAAYDSYMYNGQHFALCDAVSLLGLVYSKATLASVGINNPPATLDEWMKDCQTLKDAGIIPIGSMCASGWPSWYWSEIMDGFSTISRNPTPDEYWSRLTSTDTPFTTDSDLGKAISLLMQFKDAGYFDDPATSNWDVLRLNMDKVGFLLSGTFGFGGFTNDTIGGTVNGIANDIGFAPVPIDNSGNLYTNATPMSYYGINAATKYPETCKAFLKFWLEESGFDDTTGNSPSVYAIKSTNVQIAEFQAMNPIMLVVPAASDDYIKMLAQVQFNWSNVINDCLISGDVQGTYDNYNAQWATARAAAGLQ
ncbi:MAG: extracellular solute-binding protein, partial [Treponema sp.]|nr:extracellular solute-binding protein [Treponema sp.]